MKLFVAYPRDTEHPERQAKVWGEALKDPQVSAELAKHGLEPAPGTREELARYMERESEKWGKVVREAKIKAD